MAPSGSQNVLDLMKISHLVDLESSLMNCILMVRCLEYGIVYVMLGPELVTDRIKLRSFRSVHSSGHYAYQWLVSMS